MELSNSNPLTQDALVIELHKLGYDEANERELASYRKDKLLPPFDQVSKGRGRGAGRGKSIWLNGRKVIEQASWVYHLFDLYEYYGDVYAALWMLGFDVPLENVWASLYQPLEELTRSIDEELNRKKKHEIEATNLEELIDDTVTDFTEQLKREAAENHVSLRIFQMPHTSMTAFLNILLNRVESTDVPSTSRGYNLKETEFHAGKVDYVNCEKTARQICAEVFGEEVAEKLSPENPDSMMWMIFNNPEFINTHLSLPRLKEALEECTYEDMMIVRRDVQVVREIVQHLKRMLPLIKPKRLDELDPEPEDLSPVAFLLGRLLILADLSFRRAGYGEQIDYLVSMSDDLLKRFDEWLEREGQEVCQQIAAALDAEIERLLLLFPKIFILSRQSDPDE